MPNRTLLLEIGTEELPPKSLNRLRQTFAEKVEAGLTQVQLPFTGVESYATPRRLALRVTGLGSQQPDQDIEKRGPAKKAAFDEEDQPTKALIGFMKGCGVNDPEHLETIETDKGEYMMYRATRPGKATAELLPEIVQDALSALPIDRRMRWGKTREEFVRPVQWVVCLHGKEILGINILGTEAGRISRGHRFMSNGDFELADADSYIDECRSQHVLVDYDGRRERIRGQLSELSSTVGGHLDMDEDLLDEVTALVEWPVALAGGFEERFLQVPPEVLISAMKEHQRYFHLVDDSGNLLPKFITVANLETPDPQVVISGNERVIRPRLADAAFFFRQDTRSSLDDKRERLGNVVFQTDLGTYLEKAKRISALAGFIAERIGVDKVQAERAALLCKADLVSDMVGEFPDLQGVMGGYYARHEHEPDEVAKGIEQHYRPTQSGGLLPESGVASCVSLADKIDSMVGLFGINQPPTGSRDPFALRRQSLGVIRICVENHLDLSLTECLNKAASLFPETYQIGEVSQYILERLTSYYGEQGISSDVVEAATDRLLTDINLLLIDDVVKTLQAFRNGATAESIVAANKRVANLLKKVELATLPEQFDPSLATDDAEKALAQEVANIDLSDAKGAGAKLERLAVLQAPVDRFFDEVLVMADDEALRMNRLALLRDLRKLFLEVADFSLLQ
ncbi:MAG: glycine--tRNA ligase subunit beta [Pseudomonadales bacterium]|nr:glycine--tRNA ligase subunit beta [Pseudomonadales bacterium]MBO6596600.1 glycine--tRNA ligase subunit beta [Pseudomonadales bacterium]MBO6656490.1 glycine--tRNA ligase subunit beta [Pseudomonadales bacterium]MBO6703295.1 glycine--tRNA ligase subunit beta [Pseudomonadales bacterium]MBO6823411.1 glycine--tRNA ligase subunit beta [Pseudomonadales bacterium]